MDRLKRRALRRHQAKCFHRYHLATKTPKDDLDWLIAQPPCTKRSVQAYRDKKQRQRPARVRHGMGFFIPF